MRAKYGINEAKKMSVLRALMDKEPTSPEDVMEGKGNPNPDTKNKLQHITTYGRVNQITKPPEDSIRAIRETPVPEIEDPPDLTTIKDDTTDDDSMDSEDTSDSEFEFIQEDYTSEEEEQITELSDFHPCLVSNVQCLVSIF